MEHSRLMRKSAVGLFLSVWRARHLGTTCTQLPFLYIDITSKCNSSCVTCGIWKDKEKDAEELTTEELIGMIPAMRRLKTRLVSIAGGEPTLRDDLETFISALNREGIAAKINTNGLQVDGERAASLADAGLSMVYISCDHPDPSGYKSIRGVDGLDRVAATIRHFRSLPRPVLVCINVAVSRMNQDVLEDLAARFIEWGVQKVQFTPLHTHLQHKEMNPEFFEPLLPVNIPEVRDTLRRVITRLRKDGIITNTDMFISNFANAYKPVRTVPCISGFLYSIVSPTGELMPCYQYPSGMSVRDKPLDELFNSELFRQHRRCVENCKLPCLDTGSAEPSIMFHLPYIALHPLEIYRQAAAHSL